MKLDLGGGRWPATGHINVDLCPGADLQVDLEEAQLPYEDGEIDEIRAKDVMEHIRNFIPLLNECWRVLKVEGEIYIEVPRHDSAEAVIDPTHVRLFHWNTFDMLCDRNSSIAYMLKPWNLIHRSMDEAKVNIRVVLEKQND